MKARDRREMQRLRWILRRVQRASDSRRGRALYVAEFALRRGQRLAVMGACLMAAGAFLVCLALVIR